MAIGPMCAGGFTLAETNLLDVRRATRDVETSAS
jgi:transcriptional regulator GlxA family with amidase domain